MRPSAQAIPLPQAVQTPPSRLARLRTAWAATALRERRLILLACSVVTLALLWGLGLAPALRTLHKAPALRADLQRQAQQMQQLKAEAQALQAMPRMDHTAARRALEETMRQRLGDSAQMQMLGEHAQISLTNTPAQALADWLADARANARATTLEAHLRRSDGTAPDAPAQWSGTLSLSLPAP